MRRVACYTENEFTMDQLSPATTTFLMLGLLWSLPWKGVAMWRAARRGDSIWFVALLFFQTFGFLEIVYIFGFSARPTKPAASKK
jgi:hypothetical protein